MATCPVANKSRQKQFICEGGITVTCPRSPRTGSMMTFGGLSGLTGGSVGILPVGRVQFGRFNNVRAGRGRGGRGSGRGGKVGSGSAWRRSKLLITSSDGHANPAQTWKCSAIPCAGSGGLSLGVSVIVLPGAKSTSPLVNCKTKSKPNGGLVAKIGTGGSMVSKGLLR